LPELPEMQALAERIDAFVGGATFTGYEPLQFSALKTFSPAPESLIDKKLETATRRGKYVILGFGDERIAFHLSQGGRVDFEEPPKKTNKAKGYVVRWKFDNNRAVLLKEFGTERKAGWWVLAADDIGPMEGLGPEPDSPEFADFIRTGTDARRIHTILRDQRTVAGIGRGYTDDALHAAKISPFASLKSMKPDDRERLLDAIATTLANGLELERKRTGGLPTKLGDHWVVHHEHGKPCPVCGTDLRRVSYESHEVTYCPTCQTGGKILADRRMSRLIR
jgi:formamidopyrimidine-DNA glycosylase